MLPSARILGFLMIMLRFFGIMTQEVFGGNCSSTEESPFLNEIELEAIGNLFEATDGSQWQWLMPYEIHGIPWEVGSDQNPCTCGWQALANRSLFGILPSSLGNLEYLTVLSLGENSLIGTVPESIYGLHSLKAFGVSHNYLTGTISPQIGNLTSLLDLNLGHNDFNGTLPETMGQMKSLEVLIIDLNPSINGTIPLSLCGMSNLTVIRLGNSDISGPIPECFGNLSNLQSFTTLFAKLSGTLPLTLTTLRNMSALNVFNNLLTGTVSEAFLHMPNLHEFNLGYNRFTGSVPDITHTINNTQLDFIFLSLNPLHGTLPASWCNLTSLRVLQIQNAGFTGTLPPCMFSDYKDILQMAMSSNAFSGDLPGVPYELPYLEYLFLEGNMLTGALPSDMSSKLPAMKQLVLSDNYLTSTIPYDIGAMTQLIYLYLDYNSFTGSLPASITQLISINELYVSYNRLTGFIPQNINALAQLVQLSLANNDFSGTVPVGISNMSQLEQLYFNTNNFEGQLTDVFDPTRHVDLAIVDISYNQFSGGLPVKLFQLPAIESISAASNCFKTSLPAEACESSSINTLILDGLSAAEECRQLLLPLAGINTYQLRYSVSGGIPQCYYTINTLQTFHASGNGITGTLPEIVLGDKLNDLSLSHNLLTGTIPTTFEDTLWYRLNIAFNRITGHVSSNLQPAAANSSIFKLEANRFSGIVPASLKDVININILDGNIFSCGASRHQLPPHDTHYVDYQCGSNQFDIGIFAWSGVMLCCVTIAIVYSMRVRVTLLRNIPLPRSWVNYISRQINYILCLKDAIHLVHVQHLRRFNAFIRKPVTVSILIVSCLLLILYGALTTTYNTYTYEFAWTLSAGYLSGIVPGICLMIVYTLLISCVVYGVHLLRAAEAEKRMSILRVTTIGSWEEAKSNPPQSITQHLTSAIRYTAIFILNFAITVSVNSAYVIIALESSTSVVALSQLFIAAYKLLWNRFAVPLLTRQVINDPNSDRTILFQYYMEYFNNIIAPCTATAIISTNCFRNVFVAPPEVHSSYSYEQCESIGKTGICTEYGTGTVTIAYSPPYDYSYQCSSTLVSTYAAVYVYMFMFSTFGKPLGYALIAQLGKYWTGFTMILPPIYRKPYKDIEHIPNFIIFEKVNFILTVYTHVNVLFSFGVVFPPLAIVICVSLWSHTYYTELTIGRYLQHITDSQYSERHGYLLDTNCKHTTTTIAHAITACMYFSASFYGFFLFDTFADSNGWVVGIIAMCLMAAVAVVIDKLIGFWFYRLQVAARQRASTLAGGGERSESLQYDGSVGSAVGAGAGGGGSEHEAVAGGGGGGGGMGYNGKNRKNRKENELTTVVNNPLRSSETIEI